MKFVADLHLHSKYSRAVSQAMTLPNMRDWAKYKGINVLATGDFTHPFWFDQISKDLEDAGNGLYRLRSTPGVNSVEAKRTPGVIQGEMSNVQFMLSCEISSIYSQGGKVRRVHNLIFFPSISSIEKFNKVLVDRRSNLRSDGRPIVGISSGELAKIALDIDDKALIIPAHAWTPWFSVFGSFSGFDSIRECFGDMEKYIFAVETGLSSDPVMNWRIEDLSNRSILSFSDAHSLEKMGREATVFEASEISYDSIYKAILNSGKLRKLRKSETPESSEGQKLRNSDKSDDLIYRNSESSEYSEKIAFTIEFYPEEGKYHFTGHRNCNFSQTVEETKKNGEICPVCKRSLTVGVMHRVEDLASKDLKAESEFKVLGDVVWVADKNNVRPSYVSIVPLLEIIAEAVGSAFKTKKVMDVYFNLVNNLGSEFAILLKSNLEDVAKYAPEKVVLGIKKVRSREIVIEPGYDGKFGVVKIWKETPGDVSLEVSEEAQLNLFA